MDTMLRLGIGSWREKGWIFDALAMLAGWRGFADDRERRWHAMALLLLTGISASCLLRMEINVVATTLYTNDKHNTILLCFFAFNTYQEAGFAHQASRSSTMFLSLTDT
jgi:hypothetical protein